MLLLNDKFFARHTELKSDGAECELELQSELEAVGGQDDGLLVVLHAGPRVRDAAHAHAGPS